MCEQLSIPLQRINAAHLRPKLYGILIEKYALATLSLSYPDCIIRAGNDRCRAQGDLAIAVVM